MNWQEIRLVPPLLFSIVCMAIFPDVKPALAADGVLEMNQACAATGCFPGDSAGFPVKISNPGSYVLTSNLDVTGEDNPEDVNAIEIQASAGRVIINLNGFAILGPTFCTGGTPPASCSPLGTGVGIRSFDNTVIIRNGRVSGMGGVGVQLVTASKVENLIITDCGDSGILGGAYQVISDNFLYRNGGDGINVSGSSLVFRNVSSGNIGMGLNSAPTTGFGHNSFNDNTGGTTDAGLEMAPNVCDGDLTCP